MNKLPFTTLRNSSAFLKYFAKEIAEKIEGFDVKVGLQANNFNNTVKISFIEGSKVKLEDAFFVIKKREAPKGCEDENFDLYAVFTEHLGYFLFYADSVKKIKEKKINRIYYNNIKD